MAAYSYASFLAATRANSPPLRSRPKEQLREKHGGLVCRVRHEDVVRALATAHACCIFTPDVRQAWMSRIDCKCKGLWHVHINCVNCVCLSSNWEVFDMVTSISLGSCMAFSKEACP